MRCFKLAAHLTDKEAALVVDKQSVRPAAIIKQHRRRLAGAGSLFARKFIVRPQTGASAVERLHFRRIETTTARPSISSAAPIGAALSV